jgi:hypothetical protein
MRIITKDPEANAVELLHSLQEQPSGWVMTFFAFSRLLEHYRSEYQLKIAMNLLSDLLGDRDGGIYQCEDASIFVLVRNVPKTLQDKLVFQLRYLFMDDPLAYTADGDENPEFSQTYPLEDMWQPVMDFMKKRMVARIRGAQLPNIPAAAAAKLAEMQNQTVIAAPAPSMSAAAVAFAEPVARLRETRALNAESLYALEQELRRVNITPLVRRQPICAAIPKTPIRSVFDEMYINIAHLREALTMDVDLLGNRWLFKYLTQTLDEKMLAMVAKDTGRYLATPISLNLNIPTLLSTSFTEFDAALQPGMKVSVVLELQLADVFADMSGFLYAKDMVQKLGYRVCLDGVTELSFPQIDRKRLGFDLIKLQWNADIASDLSSETNRALGDAIKACGANRVILTRCDNQKAVEYGQALGLSLFQGRHLDKQMNPKSTVTN